MQILIEETGALERRVNYSIPKSELEQKIQKKLNEIGKTLRLKGFRPGKVPAQVVKQRYGKQVREEVLQDVMRSGLDQAITENDLRVAALTKLQPDDSGDNNDEAAFTALFEVFPELDNVDLSDMKLESPNAEISDSDIDDMLNTLQEQRRDWQPVEGGVETDHRVLVEYSAEVDGEQIPTEGKLHLGTIIGGGVLFDAFDNALIGMQQDEQKTVELSFPDDFRESDLAGKTANVELLAQRVDEASLPELNDEFAAQFGILEGGIDKLREEVKNNLDREKTAALRKLQKNQVGAELEKRFAELELPESLVKQDAQSTRQRMLQEVEQAGGDVNQVPPIEQLLDNARQRVRGSIILNDIARQKSIDVDLGRVQTAIMEIASTYDQPEQVIEVYQKNEELYMQLQQTVLEDQVVEWIVEQADADEVSVTFQELMQRAKGGE